MWKPYIWDLTNNVDYAFRKHPSYHGMIPCLLRSHTYWSVSWGHSPQCHGHGPGLGPPRHQTRQPWPYEGPWLWRRSPSCHLREWVQGHHRGHRSPDMTPACVALWRHCTPRLQQSWALWLWPGMIWFFFFSWLWRWVVNFFWPGMICIPWDFVLYRIGEVRLFTQGYFLRNKWKNTKLPGNIGEVHGNAAESWHYSIYTLFSSSAML